MLSLANKWLIGVLVICAIPSWGQTVEVEHTVKFKFEGLSMAEMLHIMTTVYDTKLSYVPDRLPLDQQVAWNPTSDDVTKNVEDFFTEYNIKYLKIGDQYVLKYDEQRSNDPNLLPMSHETDQSMVQVYDEEQAKSIEAPTSPTFEEVQNDSSEERPTKKRIPRERSIQEILNPQLSVEYEKEEPTLNWQEYPIPDPVKKSNNEKVETLLEDSQISILPGYGTTLGKTDKVNKASFNLLWGKNGGVDGVEVGLLANSITENVKGAQFAGFHNQVEGNVQGVQASGFSNFVNGNTDGWQVAGTINKTKNLTGVQASGLINVVVDSSKGLQAAGLSNIHSGAQGGFQIAGLSNHASGRAKSQISGIANIADTIEGIQFAGILNKAKQVEGMQIGLINIADSVSGASIGILNFVKHGYNHFEFYHAEALTVNLAFVFGSHAFYNRIATGINWRGNDFTWSIGYGIGTQFRVLPKSSIVIDLTSSHVNKNGWSNYLSLLNTLSLTLNTKMANRLDFYIGPTFNLYLKNRPNIETFTADLIPYYQSNTNTNGNNDGIALGWVGWKVGFRI